MNEGEVTLMNFVLLFWFDFENGVFCLAVFDL